MNYLPLTIHKASAGSGKTFNLARDYITLLLGVQRNPDDPSKGLILNNRRMLPDGRLPERNRHRSILAITFTNKATEEMKERIIEELEKLSRNFNDPDVDARSKYTEHLMENLGGTPEQIAQTAEAAMRQILNDYTHFNVSTIDSFFQLVLRNMAYELDCPGDYEVTLDEEGVLGESVGRMLDNINRPGADVMKTPLVRKIRAYMLNLRRNADSVNVFNRDISIFKKIVKFARNLFDEGYRLISKDFEDWMSVDGNMTAFSNALVARKENLTEKALAIGKALDACVDSYPGYSKKDLSGNGVIANTLKKFAQKKLEISTRIGIAINDTAELRDHDYLDQMHERIPAESVGKKSSPIPLDLYEHIMLELRHITAIYNEIKALDTVMQNIETFELMYEIKQFVHQYIGQNNLVILSDTSQLLCRMLGRDHDQVPFMYEKIGVRLHHFLIDEFQDTSVMQWETLEPLVSEGLAAGHQSLIIGDEKQAIYRFRNSDSSLLHSVVPNHYSNQTLLRGKDATENTNHRSSHLIVRFNNTVFSRICKKYNEDTFDNVVQTPSPQKAHLGGRIEIANLVDGAEGADGTDGEDITAKRARLMLENIRRQKDAGYEYKDIAILVSTNKQCREMVRLLINADIPVATDEAMTLSQSDAVNMVAGIMGLMASPRRVGQQADAKDIANVYGPRRHMDDTTMLNRFESFRNRLLMQGTPADEATNKALKMALQPVRPDDLCTTFSSLGVSHSSTLTTLVEAIINRYITPERRVAESPFLAAFHDNVATFSRANGQNLVAFMRWWRTKGVNVSVSADAGANAVKVMTIHKSKGLQFPCVHLPFVGQSLYGSSSKQDTKWLLTPPIWRKIPEFPPALHIKMVNGVNGYGSPLRDAWLFNRHERFMDGLNRVYVAFTRAINELNIYLSEELKEGSFSRDLLEVLTMPFQQPVPKASKPEERDPEKFLMDTAQGVDEVCQVCYEKVAEPKPEDDENVPMPKEKPAVMDFSDYNIAIGADAPKITNAVSVLDVEADIKDDDENDGAKPAFTSPEIERGNRIHHVLEGVHRLSDLDRNLRAATRRDTLTVDEADVIRRFFSDDDLQEHLNTWFNDFTYECNEVSIYDPAQKDAKERNKRIDRLVRTADDEIHILDYKTSADEPDPAHYRSTMREYVRRVKTLYPDVTVRAFLLYLYQNKIFPVT